MGEEHSRKDPQNAILLESGGHATQGRVIVLCRFSAKKLVVWILKIPIFSDFVRSFALRDQQPQVLLRRLPSHFVVRHLEPNEGQMGLERDTG